MTPEEKAVIEAAVKLYHEGQNDHWTACVVENAVGKMLASRESAPEWAPAILSLCLAGDHIRIGTDETDVLSSSVGTWHVDNTDPWHPKPWTHVELYLDLAANPGFQQYPPNSPVEILCSPERKAALLLQSAFPGSAVISSDVD